jgi:NitT/TauT family transport system permease protein
MQRISTSAIRSVRPALGVLLLLLVWQSAADLGGWPWFPGPRAVLEAALSEARSGQLLQHLGVTLLRVAAVFLLAISAGSVIGLALVRRSPVVTTLLASPAAVIVIALYAWFGLTEAAIVAAVASCTIPNLALAMRDGVRAIDRDYAEVAAVYGFGWRRTLRHVVLPQLAPHLLGAVRNTLALTWMIVVVIELLGWANGVGFQLQSSFQLFDVAGAIASGLAFFACALAIERRLLVPLERRVMVWRR